MLKELLDRPIAFHRCLAVLAGSVNGGVMLSQALYWSSRTTLPDGWFHKTREEWEEETMLTRYEQDGVRKTLRTTSFWKEELRGVPATVHYKIDIAALREALQTSLGKNRKLASGKPPNKNGENRQTFTSSETTTETTQKEKATTLHATRAALPDWLPKEEWKEFCEMRQRTRTALTEAGKRRVIAKLDALRCRGHDPGKVLGRSIENSWRSVFELPETEKGNLHEQAKAIERKYGVA